MAPACSCDNKEGRTGSAPEATPLETAVQRVELIARVRSLVRSKRYTDELERAETVLMTLARSIESRDPNTGDHCERLSRLSGALGERMGLGDEEITALRRGGVVHDIGKVLIPDAILLKQGPLAPGERAIMQQHPVEGEHICKPLKSMVLVPGRAPARLRRKQRWRRQPSCACKTAWVLAVRRRAVTSWRLASRTSAGARDERNLPNGPYESLREVQPSAPNAVSVLRFGAPRGYFPCLLATPSRFIRYAKVVGLRSSAAAAPSSP